MLSIIAGIGILRGANWGRLIFAIWNPISMVIGLATSPVPAMILPGLVMYGVVMYFLYRHPSSAFFIVPATADAQGS